MPSLEMDRFGSWGSARLPLAGNRGGCAGAVTELRPTSLTWTAKVPLLFELTVQNFGTEPAKNVAVSIYENGIARSGVNIEEIAAGKSEKATFQAILPTAGFHEIKAELPQDPVETDNARFAQRDHCVDSKPTQQSSSQSLAMVGKRQRGQY